MTDLTSEALPWDRLVQPDERLPWEVIERFAAAVKAEAGLWRRLAEVFGAGLRTTEGPATFEVLYVPAILALAAPALDDAVKVEVAGFIQEGMREAGEMDDDLALEALLMAGGALGPVILPGVLEHLEKLPADAPEIFHAWGLLEVATQAAPEMQARVAEGCRRVLAEIVEGNRDIGDVGMVTTTMVRLRDPEAAALLARIQKMRAPGGQSAVDAALMGGDVREALADLQCEEMPKHCQALWEQPVRAWAERQFDLCQRMLEGDWQGEDDAPWRAREEEGPVELPFVRAAPKVGRNEPCPCGSGKKYKKCCGR